MKTLEIKKIKRSWCIVSGRAVLGKFRTEALAKANLETKESFYLYWAGSAGASMQHSTPVTIEA